MNDVPLKLVRPGDGTRSLIRSQRRTKMDSLQRVSVDCLAIRVSDMEYTQYTQSYLQGYKEIACLFVCLLLTSTKYTSYIKTIFK